MDKIEYDQCPLCRSPQIEKFLTTEDFLKTGEPFDLLSCHTCGFVFTQGVPAAEEAGAYYESEDYISHSDTKKGVINKLYHPVRQYMLKRKYRLISHLTKGRALLDIGCGTGYFPAYMQQKGYQATGVEINPAARSTGEKKFGLTILPPEKFLAQHQEHVYDVITLWHVLEHLYDPGRYLEQMHLVLKEHGILVIALPNHHSLDARHYGKFWAGYDVPRHLWHFTPETLKQLAGQHHFRVIKMKGMPFDPFFNALLSGKYKQNPRYFISGLIIGKLAYLKGLFQVEQASSVIYVLKKHNT